MICKLTISVSVRSTAFRPKAKSHDWKRVLKDWLREGPFSKTLLSTITAGSTTLEGSSDICQPVTMEIVEGRRTDITKQSQTKLGSRRLGV